MKAIKKDYGYDIEENGEIPFRLLPCHTIQSIKLLRARIQSNGGYPSIHGIAYMPVAVVDYDEDEDGISNYWSPRTNFTNVSFSKNKLDNNYFHVISNENEEQILAFRARLLYQKLLDKGFRLVEQ